MPKRTAEPMALKGTIFDIKKFAIHDGPGIRTTIFFKGCPLSCIWCSNPESQNPGPEVFRSLQRVKSLNLSYCEVLEHVGKEVSTDEVLSEITKDISHFDESGGGVTCSGGEPLMQHQFLGELLQECKARDIHTALDTTGYTSRSILSRIKKNVDLFLFDLKIFDEELHKQYTGVPNRQIKDNLQFLASEGDHIIIRVPIIPGVTDSEQNLTDIATYVADIGPDWEVDLLPYIKMSSDKYKRFHITSRMEPTEPPSDERMQELKTLFEQFNLNVKIGG